MYGIHWFRRDLRVTGNLALAHNFKHNGGRVLGLFCFDAKFLARPDFSANRFGFFLKTLNKLKSELLSRGGDLLVLDASPETSFENIVDSLKNYTIELPTLISFNRDYEPFARERDERINALLKNKFGIEVHTNRDHLVIEPHELKKNDATYYQVYTPFSKKWAELFETDKIQERIAQQQKSLGITASKSFCLTWKDLYKDKIPFIDKLDEYTKKTLEKVTVPLPEAGFEVAYKNLKFFIKERCQNYKEQRNFPAISGTSKLSIYLKNGSITTSQILAELDLKDINVKDSSGEITFVKEIIWREFYYHILYHQPRIEKESFQVRYKDLDWENNLDLFEAWKKGETGYPIIDAGMRELNQTGWMHNRVRMIVASFLTKDLLIDYRYGERYFMEKLLDGDLAPNNGGWQWSASTGCDAQPYFRVFNPLLQSQKFDAEGVYLKKYLPELKNLSLKEIHCANIFNCNLTTKYPKPIIDHQERKLMALKLYSL